MSPPEHAHPADALPFCVASFGMSGTTWSSDDETYFSNVNVYLQAGGDEGIRVPYTIEVGNPVYDFIPDEEYYNWEVRSELFTLSSHPGAQVHLQMSLLTRVGSQVYEAANGTFTGSGVYELTPRRSNDINIGFNVAGPRDAAQYHPTVVAVDGRDCEFLK